MPRKLKTDIPGTDWRLPAEPERRLDLESLYAGWVPSPFPFVVDLGFGRGEFLLEQATANPDTAFLGVEISWKRSLKMARRLARTELRNVRLLETTAQVAVSAFIPRGSVSRFWINFPDPWPKKRHQGRRLVAPAFVASLAERLTPEGQICVATDHVEYAEAIDAVLAHEPRLQNVYAPEPFLRENPGRTTTAYEQIWRDEGRSFHFFAYRRRSVASGRLGAEASHVPAAPPPHSE